MITEKQKKIIDKGVKSMKKEKAPNFLINDYIFEMICQFEDENRGSDE